MFRFINPAIPAVALAASIAIAGCQSSHAEPNHAQNAPSLKKGQASQQLILKFKLSSTPRFACDASGVFRFAADAGVRLEFLRPMSGDACVVLQSADGGDALAQGLARMKQHSAVEWIEIDAVMKAL